MTAKRRALTFTATVIAVGAALTAMAAHYLPLTPALGRCAFYVRHPWFVWTVTIADLVIAAAYVVIPLLLVSIMRRRRDIPFGFLFGAFGTFIVACGMTHAASIGEVWSGIPAVFWAAAGIRLVAATASLLTLAVLYDLHPLICSLPTKEQLIAAERARLDAEADLRAAHRFVRQAGHELRTPLSPMPGAIQLLRDEVKSEDGRRLLQMIEDGADRAGKTIDGLLGRFTLPAPRDEDHHGQN